MEPREDRGPLRVRCIRWLKGGIDSLDLTTEGNTCWEDFFLNSHRVSAILREVSHGRGFSRTKIALRVVPHPEIRMKLKRRRLESLSVRIVNERNGE
jgi:hypothetical protein